MKGFKFAALSTLLVAGTLAYQKPVKAEAVPTPIHAVNSTSTTSKEVLLSQRGRVCVGFRLAGGGFKVPVLIYQSKFGSPIAISGSTINVPTSAVVLDGPKDVGIPEGMAYLVQLDGISQRRGWVSVDAVKDGRCNDDT